MHNGQHKKNCHKDWVRFVKHVKIFSIMTIIFHRATNEDEMCNFYLMYYVDGDEPLDQKYCFTAGPPYYYWSNQQDQLGLSRIPEDASQL